MQIDAGLGATLALVAGAKAKQKFDPKTTKGNAITLVSAGVMGGATEPYLRNFATGTYNSGIAAIESNNIKKLELDL